MPLRTTAVVVLLLIAGATSVHAAAVTLLSAGLDSEGGAMTCHVMNGSKKTVESIIVVIAPITQPDNGSSSSCQEVAAGSGCPVTLGVGSAGSYFCRVTISKGSKKDFRASFCDVASGNCSEAR